MPKTFLISAVATLVLTTASIATADTYFGFGNTLDDGSVLQLGLITADADGVVEIYDFHADTVGLFLGSEDIHAGANPDVRVQTHRSVKQNVIAVVKIGGQVVVEKEFDVVDD